MGEHTSTQPVAGDNGRSTLGELIHVAVRRAIEAAVEAELAATLGAGRYERRDSRQGYRNGTKTRTLSGPTGALALTLPRATMATGTGRREWTSTVVPPATNGGCGRSTRRCWGGERLVVPPVL
jgi:transposase-like protein